MRKSSRLAALVAVLAIVSTACTGGGGSGDNGSGGTPSGGHLILGTLSNIDTLNPFRTFQQNSYATFEYIYPQLVQLDTKTLDFIPDFASKWEQSKDGLTWTFHTMPNATWSDGKPLTADDVAFTYNTIIKYADGAAGNLAGGLANVTSVKATDANTVVLTYSAPVANVLSNLQQISILPEQVWGQYATRRWIRPPPVPQHADRSAARERRAVRVGAVREGPIRHLPEEPELLRASVRHRWVRPPVLLQRRLDGAGAP